MDEIIQGGEAVAAGESAPADRWIGDRWVGGLRGWWVGGSVVRGVELRVKV